MNYSNGAHPSNTIANWCNACFQSLIGIIHFLDILRGQKELLEDGVIAREETPIFDNLAQRVIARFIGVGRVDL